MYLLWFRALQARPWLEERNRLCGAFVAATRKKYWYYDMIAIKKNGQENFQKKQQQLDIVFDTAHSIIAT